MKVKKFQVGGEMPAAPASAEQAPQGGGATTGGNPEEQLAQMAMQIVEQLGPQMAAALAEMIMQVLQQSAGGQQAAPQGEPVYAKKGGKLTLIGRR